MKIPFTNLELNLRSKAPSDDFWWKQLFPSTDTGIVVTETGALNLATVFACVRVLSETLSSLPLIMYRREGRAKHRATDHPYYDLMHNAPNDEMTSYEFRTAMMFSEILWGKAFAHKIIKGNRVVSLVPLLPQYMTRKRDEDGKLIYDYRETGKQRVFGRNEILDMKCITMNGVDSVSIIECARNSIGLGFALERFGSRFFKNGARATGGFKLPGPAPLKQDAYDRLKKSIRENTTGENQLGFLILEQGMEWQQMAVPPNDAQFLESKEFSVTEICRWFRVQPHKVADLKRATFSNIEHQALEFVVDTMMPWFAHWEQRLNFSMLTPEERKTYYWEFLVDGLLRGDLKSRYEAYAVARNWGWMSADDVLEIENRNPLPDDKGQVYLQPLNMVEAGTVPELNNEDEVKAEADVQRLLKYLNIKRSNGHLQKQGDNGHND